ncbi:MAG: TM2 domain-containing protein [Deltaproteobacteria bacterium]|nr:MAG: TM2 domain-containing protein [Deltaproteobacteria bacterium]
MAHALAQHRTRDTGIAYLLLIVGFLGLSGLHRIYAGRWLSGLIWFVTGGLCMVGNIVDIFLLPQMLEDAEAGKPVW